MYGSECLPPFCMLFATIAMVTLRVLLFWAESFSLSIPPLFLIFSSRLVLRGHFDPDNNHVPSPFPTG